MSSPAQSHSLKHDRKIELTTVEKMQNRISDPPRLLSSSTSSIFRAPQSLAEANGEVYHPRIVSIGPYHRNAGPGLRMIEEHKWRYLGSLLARRSEVPSLAELMAAMAGLEAQARECYAEEIVMSSDEFCETMVVDACFLVELFRKADGVVAIDSDDPVFFTAWIVPFTYKDLLRLENQIPFLVLQAVFELTGGTSDIVDLCLLGLRFFNCAMRRPEEAITRCMGQNPNPKHLLDLVRLSMIPPNLRVPTNRTTPAHVIHCVSKLRRAGIKLREPKSSCRESMPSSFLVVNFRGGVLEMPKIAIDDFTASFLQNVVAFEQCHNSGAGGDKHFTAYATLLDCLVNTDRDVEYLCDKDVVENCYGNDHEVARLVNALGKDVAFDIDLCYLADVFDDVHFYYRNSWHVNWADFKYRYFDSPWSFISALAALVLLLLTVAQTIYTVFGFYASNNNKTTR